MLYLVTGIWKLTGHKATVPIHAESEERARFVAEWGGLIPTQVLAQQESGDGAEDQPEQPSRSDGCLRE